MIISAYRQFYDAYNFNTQYPHGNVALLKRFHRSIDRTKTGSKITYRILFYCSYYIFTVSITEPIKRFFSRYIQVVPI